jgi:hypothetical protein
MECHPSTKLDMSAFKLNAIVLNPKTFQEFTTIVTGGAA